MEGIFLLGILCGIICFIMAENRGRDTILWAIAGMVFGIVAILVLWTIGDINGEF